MSLTDKLKDVGKSAVRKTAFAGTLAGALLYSGYNPKNIGRAEDYNQPIVAQSPIADNTQNLEVIPAPIAEEEKGLPNFINGVVHINGLRIGEFDPNFRKAHLFYDGNLHPEVKGAYISMNKDRVIISAKGTESPTVQFLPRSNYAGLKVEDDDFVLMQARDGVIAIQKGKEDNITDMISLGEYTAFFGKHFLRYDEETKETGEPGPRMGKINPNTVALGEKDIRIFSDFLRRAGSCPMRVVTLDKNGERVCNWDVVVDNYNRIRGADPSQLEKYLGSNRKGIISSIRNSFHRLLPDEQDKFANVDLSLRSELSNYSTIGLRNFLKEYNPSEEIKMDGKIGAIAVNPSIVEEWKRDKEAELREKYGRNVIVDPVIHGTTKDGYMYVDPELVNEWKRDKEAELREKYGREVIVEPDMKRPE